MGDWMVWFGLKSVCVCSGVEVLMLERDETIKVLRERYLYRPPTSAV